MDINDIRCPKFAWILLVVLGYIDIIRGIMHTFVLEFAAHNIFVVDLSGGVDNQIFLLGLFGITNYLTGILYILIGLKSRQLVPIVLPVIPITYLLGSLLIRRVATPTAALGGNFFMLVYFAVCIAATVAVIVINIKNRKVKN